MSRRSHVSAQPALWLSLLFLLCLAPAFARAAPGAQPADAPTELVLQNGLNGYAGCVDTYINRWNVDVNYANAPSLNVEYSSSGDVSSTLLHFDMSPVPAGAQITSAILGIYTTSYGFDTGLTIGAYVLKRPWVVDEVTWRHAQTGEPWQTPGANGVVDDRAALPIGTKTTDGTNRWVFVDVTSLASQWLDGPATNYGVILRAEGTSGPAGKSYYSFIYSDATGASAAWSPKLTILYQPAGGPTSTSTASAQPPTGTATRTRTATPSATPIGPTYTPTRTVTRTRTPTASPTNTPPTISPVGTLVFQNGLNGYAGCEDTFISTFSKTTNFGNNEIMELRAKDEENLLLRFDLSGLNALPADARVDVAVLSVWCTQQGTNLSPIYVDSYRLLRPWSETQATWNVARTGDPWGQPGAFQFGVDRDPQISVTGVLDRPDMWLHQDWTFLVRQWRQAPAINHGAVISGTGWAHITYWFASSENPTQAIRPRLVISYTNPTFTPTATVSRRGWLPLVMKP